MCVWCVCTCIYTCFCTYTCVCVCRPDEEINLETNFWWIQYVTICKYGNKFDLYRRTVNKGHLTDENEVLGSVYNGYLLRKEKWSSCDPCLN